MGKYIRKFLPSFANNFLFGAREQYGLKIIENDPCWIKWKDISTEFYLSNQRKNIGLKVNDAGYTIMKEIDLTDKIVLEVGPGDIRHLKYLKGKPKKYLLADVSTKQLDLAELKLKKKNIPCSKILVSRNKRLPLENESVDIIISFYSLEHLYPLSEYLNDMKRVLKFGGYLVGAIPTEGGLAWGIGRGLTSRRWIKKNTTINPDKIICWEHPNFGDQVIEQLNDQLIKKKITFWPFKIIPMIDLNLIIKFIYKKENKLMNDY